MADYKYWMPEGTGYKEVKTSSNAVIFIGANGAGKSRLGAWIERKDTDYVHRIGAQRNLNFQETIPLRSYNESEDLVLFGNADQPNRNRKFFKYNNGTGSESDKYVTHFFDDFTNVLSALIAKSNNENNKFIYECKEAEQRGATHPHTPETDIDKLMSVWSDIFPQRSLLYNDSRFYADDPASEKKEEYSATKMSDGERTTLYFIAQVLAVPSNKLLLIDEPELHLHKSLMNRLWLALEKYRPDCLFIYITHDTQFAALHVNADKYWVKSYSGDSWDIEKIESQDLPEDLLLDLLGNRKNVLFVEGTSGSYDTQLYSLVYKDYYVVPCGSCTQVIAHTKAFNSTGILHHYKAYGLIDRDYRSDHEIEVYKNDNIFTIEVAEVENLFITEELIRAIAKLHGANEEDVFQKVYTYIVKDRFGKQIDSQVCQAVVSEIKYRLSSIEIDKKNEAIARMTLNQGLSSIDYEAIKQEIEKRFKTVVDSGDYKKVIRIFNEKGLAKTIGHFMSVADKDYCQIVIGMLRNGAINIEDLLGQYLPKADLIPR